MDPWHNWNGMCAHVKCGARWWVSLKATIFAEQGEEVILPIDDIETYEGKHRVVITSTRERYSTAFFAYFNYRAKLEPLTRYVHPGRELRWPPMDTMEWFQYKRASSGLDPSTSGLRLAPSCVVSCH